MPGFKRFTEVASVATTTTNPDPNTLTTSNPYDTDGEISGDWTSQGVKLIHPNMVRDGSGDRPIVLAFNPSSGSATFTIKVWYYVGEFDEWLQYENNTPSQSFTGKSLAYVDNHQQLPFFIEVDALSAGTLAIAVDTTTVAEVV